MAINNNICKDNDNATVLATTLTNNPDIYNPFTPQEEEEFISNNIDNLDYVREELIRRNTRLVYNIAKRYAKTTESFDDTIQAGMLGLSIAASRFDFKKGTRFCTYATWWIRKYVLMPFYNKDVINPYFKPNNVYLDATINTSFSSDDNRTYESIIDEKLDPSLQRPIESKSISAQLTAKTMKDLVENISEVVDDADELNYIDKAVYKLYFKEKNTIKNVSAQLNVTNKDVYKSKEKIQAFVKQYLAKDYKINSYYDI